MHRRLTIGTRLLAVNAVVLLVPLLSIIFFRLYETALVEQVERRLISESVVIGEIWREHLRAERPANPIPLVQIHPPGAADPNYAPIDPRIDIRDGVLPPEPAPDFVNVDRSGPTWRAGRALMPLLQRSKVFNLSGIRVLNNQGCIVASSGSELGGCYRRLAPLTSALNGEYAAVARKRYRDEDAPPLASIQRAGKVRVFTAVPVFEDGEVIGVVKASRTTLSVVKALWLQRDQVFFALGACLLLTIALSYFLSRTITRPVKQITRAANSVAHHSATAATSFEISHSAPAEVYQLKQALQSMLKQLNTRAAYISEFSANVSHELKTPLTSMRGAAQLLLDNWQTMAPAQRESFIRNIDSDAERTEELINGLLALAKIDVASVGDQRIVIAPLVKQLCKPYGSQVKLQLQGSLSDVAIDPDHLRIVLRNLLDNAVRHGEPKPVALRVTADAQQITFAITDRGPGVSPGNRARIFQRFFTTEREHGGTGLGLAIVKAIADKYRAKLTFDTGSEGTTFTFAIPQQGNGQ